MGLTTDPNDPRLGHGIDTEPRPQHEVYLVLSEEERAAGFVRPVRRSYLHVGASGPTYPLRDLDEQEKERFSNVGYVAYEQYPEGGSSLGRYWTQDKLDNVGRGCGAVTTMGLALAETYAREPHFYGATYCATCQKHLAVDEFVWAGTDARVGS